MRWALTLCLGLLVVGPGARSLSRFAIASTSRTELRIFMPFAPDGLARGYRVTERKRADCWIGSIASPNRPDAWRCSTPDGLILDPCLENPFQPGTRELACAWSPWDRRLVVIRARQLPEKYRNDGTLREKARPWALELANGAKCLLITGTALISAGVRWGYGCGNGYASDEIDRSGRLWKVFFWSTGRVSAERATVVVAWY
jgi:hypothetical protein